MSYDIFLKDPITGNVCELLGRHLIEGGTYITGGTTVAEINITYNYSEHFFNSLGTKGIRCIYGMTGYESIVMLAKIISEMKDDVSSDYWEATEGNAKEAIKNLIRLALLAPHGIWDGD